MPSMDEIEIMNLKSYKKLFSKALTNQYSKKEIDSLFYVLVDFYLGISRIKFIQEPMFFLSKNKINLLDSKLKLIKNKMPIQYVTGKVLHKKLTFYLNENVLIPRPETVELCDWIISDQKNKISILDIGTGSGLISIILKKYLDNSNVEAWDKSIKALEIAKKNSLVNNVKINFKEVDVLKKIEFNNKYDLIVSNPPYVDKSEIPSIDVSVSKFEPHSAIFVDGDDNLVFYKKIIEFSKVALNDLGVLYLECHTDRIKSIKNLLKINNFKKITIKEDLNGRERMIKAYK